MNIELDRLKDENKRLREALHPGKAPCDCIEKVEYKGERFWDCDCGCGNRDDYASARSWCNDASRYEGVTGDPALQEQGNE